MANILNIDAETGTNIIGDDSQPALTIENNSTGRALDLKGAAASALRVSVSTGAANATAKSPLELVGTSIASGAVLSLVGLRAWAFCSTSTIKAITAVAANCGVIRVCKPDGTFGWIPVYPDAAVTGIAV